jgi:AcrR family transcriptional regulator
MACEPGCAVCDRLGAATLALVGEERELSLDVIAGLAGVSAAEAREHCRSAADCLHATYERVAEELAADFEDSFSEDLAWEDALGVMRRRLLARLAAEPGIARLCFAEALGRDRELGVLRDRRRRWTIDFLAGRAELSKVQTEMLIGVTFHEISMAVERGDGSQLPALEPRLAELVTLFEPSVVRA